MTKIKYTYYTAGAIEKATDTQMVDWRKEVKEKLNTPEAIQYNPVERETQKTGKPAGEQTKYISGLKQAGLWEKFLEEMDKIWLGTIRPEANLIEIFLDLRNRKCIDGNEMRDLDFWADYEATIRSDFVVALMKKDIPTVGTYGEIFICYLLHIPVYLVLPDQSKTDCNSTLLYWVLRSGGDVFYSISEACNFIRDKYKLKEVKEEKK